MKRWFPFITKFLCGAPLCGKRKSNNAFTKRVRAGAPANKSAALQNAGLLWRDQPLCPMHIAHRQLRWILIKR